MTDDVFLIKQDGVRGIDQVISLFKGHELLVERMGKRKATNYRINTLVLADKGAWRLRFPWPSLIIIAAVIIALLPGSLITYASTRVAVWSAHGLGALIVVLCLYWIWKHTTIVRTFRTLHAHHPLVELARNKPSREEFESFVKHLEENIKGYQQQHRLPEDKQLAGEMRTLRRLKNEKIISRTAYENAKEKLFKLF